MTQALHVMYISIPSALQVVNITAHYLCSFLWGLLSRTAAPVYGCGLGGVSQYAWHSLIAASQTCMLFTSAVLVAACTGCISLPKGTWDGQP